MIRSTPVVIFKILIMLKVSANNMINMGSEGWNKQPVSENNVRQVSERKMGQN